MCSESVHKEGKLNRNKSFGLSETFESYCFNYNSMNLSTWGSWTVKIHGASYCVYFLNVTDTLSELARICDVMGGSLISFDKSSEKDFLAAGGMNRWVLPPRNHTFILGSVSDLRRQAEISNYKPTKLRAIESGGLCQLYIYSNLTGQSWFEERDCKTSKGSGFCAQPSDGPFGKLNSCILCKWNSNGIKQDGFGTALLEDDLDFQMTRNIVHKVGFAEADEYCQVKFGGHLLSIRSYAQGETFRGFIEINDCEPQEFFVCLAPVLPNYMIKAVTTEAITTYSARGHCMPTPNTAYVAMPLIVSIDTLYTYCLHDTFVEDIVIDSLETARVYCEAKFHGQLLTINDEAEARFVASQVFDDFDQAAPKRYSMRLLDIQINGTLDGLVANTFMYKKVVTDDNPIYDMNGRCVALVRSYTDQSDHIWIVHCNRRWRYITCKARNYTVLSRFNSEAYDVLERKSSSTLEQYLRYLRDQIGNRAAFGPQPFFQVRCEERKEKCRILMNSDNCKENIGQALTGNVGVDADDYWLTCGGRCKSDRNLNCN
ncbi:unnamed protein product [Enterobius vermicularis]|uniref:C-type lectin domain-containing protein n=1 Tax=Enterobius vermicularis TaxID=51028 RepID=A0A0N4V1X9_ENTVE|nr:unnamed protein product [Enterobius vermicularis]